MNSSKVDSGATGLLGAPPVSVLEVVVVFASAVGAGVEEVVLGAVSLAILILV